MLNIVVLVSGGGTNLQALIDGQKEGRIKGGKITAVVSSKPGAYALTRAENAGIATYVLERKQFSDQDSYNKALGQLLDNLNAGLIVLAGFMTVLSPALVRKYENRIINVHPALIPAFSGTGFYGLGVHRAALDYGVKYTGATVHFVSEETDGGPIILQQPVPVLPGDTPETLQRRVMEQGEWILLPKAVSLFCEGRLSVNGRIVTIKNECSEGMQYE